VGNLSYDATEADLEDLFKGFGSVKAVEIVYNRRTHRSKGYAFVTMHHLNDAKRAVDVLHDQPYMRRTLVVNGAVSEGQAKREKEEERESEPSQGG
jgi:RNA recognition motif-containing protein